MKYCYVIQGLNDSYESLSDARAMVKYYLKEDSIYATKLRGARGMKMNIIWRYNLDNGTRKAFPW